MTKQNKQGRPRIPDLKKKTARYQIGLDAGTGFKLYEYARIKGVDVTQLIEFTLSELVNKKPNKMLEHYIDELNKIPDEKKQLEEEHDEEMKKLDDKCKVENEAYAQKLLLLDERQERLKQKIKELKTNTKERGQKNDDDKRRRDDEEIAIILSKPE